MFLFDVDLFLAWLFLIGDSIVLCATTMISYSVSLSRPLSFRQLQNHIATPQKSSTYVLW